MSDPTKPLRGVCMKPISNIGNPGTGLGDMEGNLDRNFKWL